MKPCADHTPPGFVGHWRDWHRGHGCDRDDGKPRSAVAKTEVAQLAESVRTGFLTDAELRMLRAATTSGNDVLVRALDELTARRGTQVEVLKAVAVCEIGKKATADPAPFCGALDTWAGLMIKAKADRGVDEKGTFDQSWREVRMAITKSCLLDRVLNHHEQPSQTPCPVHKGIWIGCHVGWPDQVWSDGHAIEVDARLQEWHDAGCRCHLHNCGCTTGWNPDEHCGCLKKDSLR